MTEATQAGDYHLYERVGDCHTCGHTWTVKLTGQAYREADDQDNLYWYAVAGQECPNCGQPVAGITQALSEIMALGFTWWYIDAEGNRIDTPAEEIDTPAEEAV